MLARSQTTGESTSLIFPILRRRSRPHVRNQSGLDDNKVWGFRIFIAAFEAAIPRPLAATKNVIYSKTDLSMRSFFAYARMVAMHLTLWML